MFAGFKLFSLPFFGPRNRFDGCAASFEPSFERAIRTAPPNSGIIAGAGTPLLQSRAIAGLSKGPEIRRSEKRMGRS